MRAEISSEYRRSVTQCEESDPDHLKVPTELAASKSRQGATLDIRTLLSKQGRLIWLQTSAPVRTCSKTLDLNTGTQVQHSHIQRGEVGQAVKQQRVIRACSLTCVANPLKRIWRM